MPAAGGPTTISFPGRHSLRAQQSIVLDEFVHQPRVAFFSMEIALCREIPTYAGGLGILAGDMLRSATDLGLPLVAVSLVSRAGYFRQEIDVSGRQIEHAALWEPLQWAAPLTAKVAISLEGRSVWIGAWLYVHEGPSTAISRTISMAVTTPTGSSRRLCSAWAGCCCCARWDSVSAITI
jgi:glucan phosphorylase